MITKLRVAFLVVSWLASVAWAQAQPGASTATPGAVNFARDILPVLSNKCFVCHGPDSQEADTLRLDSFQAATVDRGGYRALDPDSPAKSEILARIESADDPMPPPEAEKQLTAAERSLLRRWIMEGGSYSQHWAFVPPRKSQPSGSGKVHASTAIDAFVEARLKQQHLDFSPEADRHTLARRAALVLTGLPPEPDQLTEFLSDERKDAYARYVETLLDSPRFGEHQARYWLDAVRYGDTHGLHLDNRRGIYPYRDWVVRAFNNNMPLNQFIVWQLAGDLLPDPSLEQLVATGFVRMNPTTSEGGAIAAEFQAKNNFDRTETLGTVLLGMTLNCARCHNHKFDPISQTEYYQLLAFFNSTAEGALDGNSYTYGPTVRVPDDQASWQQWLELDRAAQQLSARVEYNSAVNPADLDAHAAKTRDWTAEHWRISHPVEASGKLPAEGQWQDLAGASAIGNQKSPPDGKAIWLSCDIHVATGQSLWLTLSGGQGTSIYLDENAQSLTATPAGETRWQRLALAAGEHSLKIKIVGPTSGGKLAVKLENPWQSLTGQNAWRDLPLDQRLQLLADTHGPLATLGLADEAYEIVQRRRRATTRFTTTLVARELPQPRVTRVLRRGEYDQPIGDAVQPGILSVMGSFPEKAQRNRLGLANWLTDRDHPLVARVIVNRVWQRTMGQGLVRSPEDFGRQGQQPTHPLLLDWLAVELHDSDWDLKHLMRLMVNSRTFRQDSSYRDDVDDPENRSLARGPSFRLDAEVLRDVGLWASGLLDTHMGGEGVKPYQPSGMWIAMAHPASNTKRYVVDQGARLYRRSLYVYWKRTSPHPMMTLFDAPDRESSCVMRSRTNTSLQSLGLLNEKQRIEMARKLAERLLREGDDDQQRLDRLYRALSCRLPADRERLVCMKLLDSMRTRYFQARQDALALLSTGDAPRDEALDPVEVAAWTQVATTVLASDATVMLY